MSSDVRAVGEDSDTDMATVDTEKVAACGEPHLSTFTNLAIGPVT